MTTTTGPNLIVNGGFEDNALNNSGYTWQDLNSGWVNIGSRNANILEQDYGHGNATGDAVAELECGVVLCQEVNVPEAGKYIFSFDVSRRGTSDQDNKFELYINGVKYETYVAQGQETIEIELDLSAGTTRFDFKSLSHTYNGAGLDDVALHKVQEDPGSISGRYFNDRDCDGIEDQGEEGFANKIIKLRDADTGAIVAETRRARMATTASTMSSQAATA